MLIFFRLVFLCCYGAHMYVVLSINWANAKDYNVWARAREQASACLPVSQWIDVWVHSPFTFLVQNEDEFHLVYKRSKASSFVCDTNSPKDIIILAAVQNFCCNRFFKTENMSHRMNWSFACVGVWLFVALCSSSCKFTHGSNNSDSSSISKRGTFGLKS